MKTIFRTKRWSLAALCAAAILAACQGAAVGPVSGENRTGAAYLADIRSSRDLPPLAPDARLQRAAAEQARYMAEAGSMNHTTGFRRSFGRRMKSNGVNGAAAENIAHGAFGTDELFRRWMDSPPHRRNMLDPTYRRFGLASAQEAGGMRRYWALVLAK